MNKKYIFIIFIALCISPISFSMELAPDLKESEYCFMQSKTLLEQLALAEDLLTKNNLTRKIYDSLYEGAKGKLSETHMKSMDDIQTSLHSIHTQLTVLLHFDTHLQKVTDEEQINHYAQNYIKKLQTFLPALQNSLIEVELDARDFLKCILVAFLEDNIKLKDRFSEILTKNIPTSCEHKLKEINTTYTELTQLQKYNADNKENILHLQNAFTYFIFKDGFSNTISQELLESILKNDEIIKKIKNRLKDKAQIIQLKLIESITAFQQDHIVAREKDTYNYQQGNTLNTEELTNKINAVEASILGFKTITEEIQEYPFATKRMLQTLQNTQNILQMSVKEYKKYKSNPHSQSTQNNQPSSPLASCYYEVTQKKASTKKIPKETEMPCSHVKKYDHPPCMTTLEIMNDQELATTMQEYPIRNFKQLPKDAVVEYNQQKIDAMRLYFLSKGIKKINVSGMNKKNSKKSLIYTPGITLNQRAPRIECDFSLESTNNFSVWHTPAGVYYFLAADIDKEHVYSLDKLVVLQKP